MLHLGKEVGVRDLQVVFPAVGSKGVLQKNAPYGFPADRDAEDLRVFVDVLVSVAQ